MLIYYYYYDNAPSPTSPLIPKDLLLRANSQFSCVFRWSCMIGLVKSHQNSVSVGLPSRLVYLHHAN